MLIYAIVIALSIFFFTHYAVAIFLLAKAKREKEMIHNKFHQLLDEYKTYAQCIADYGKAETDEERLIILDRINVNAATSILRTDG